MLPQRISGVKTEYFLSGVLILLTFPFLVLNYFNNPTAEDFFYGEELIRKGFILSQGILNRFWGGRYFTYLFLGINPLLLKSIAAYKVTVFLLMILFCAVLYFFVNELFKNSIPFRDRFMIFISILFLYLFGMSSVSQGFYWYGSVVCYNFSIMLLLLLIIFYKRLVNSDSVRQKIFYTIICCLCSFAIAGSSEIAGVIMLIINMLMVYTSFLREKKIRLNLVIIVLVSIIFILISFTMPGNSSRANQYPGRHQLMFSLENSFEFLLQQLFIWIFNTPLLWVTILLLPVFILFIKNKSGIEIFSINPLITLIAWFGFVYSGIFIMLWSSAIVPYDRILNLIYFAFLSGWFLNVLTLLSFGIKKKLFEKINIPKIIILLSGVITLLFIFRENNITTAYTELFNGDAAKFNNEVNERYDFIKNSSVDSVKVDSLSKSPKSFFYMDITTDPKIFYNRGYANYFNKKAIMLKKYDNQTKTEIDSLEHLDK